jgi:hypothetical protein
MIDIGTSIDGNTFDADFVITNNSSGGIEIDSIVFDFTPLASTGICFDLIASSCHRSGGSDFSGSSLSGNVGFTTVFSDAVGGISSLDTLLINFTNFTFGEVFSFNVDIDNNTNGSVFGNDLIGAIIKFNMSNGTQLVGVFDSVIGNADAASFLLTSDSTEISAPLVGALMGFFGIAMLTRKRKS